MNVVFVDYYNPESDNGICAYHKYLSDFLQKIDALSLYEVRLYRADIQEATVSVGSGITSIDLPYDLVVNKRPGTSDIEFIELLKSLLNFEDGTIIHLNWMNHAYITPLIKHHIVNSRVILTKHCVSWRENVVHNYGLFKDIESILYTPISNNVFVKRILREEITFFSLVDHVITVTDDARDILIRLYGLSENKVTRIYNGIPINKSVSFQNYKKKYCVRNMVLNKKIRLYFLLGKS